MARVEAALLLTPAPRGSEKALDALADAATTAGPSPPVPHRDEEGD